jgi:hypothetical protein
VVHTFSPFARGESYGECLLLALVHARISIFYNLAISDLQSFADMP